MIFSKIHFANKLELWKKKLKKFDNVTYRHQTSKKDYLEFQMWVAVFLIQWNAVSSIHGILFSRRSVNSHSFKIHKFLAYF